MALNRTDAEAIAGLASRLGVHPGTLGGLMEMESGIDPNIWGGDGKQYRGLIQFGPGARKEVGLPGGQMSIADQIPYVEKYFKQRGFQPGKHGATELYRTVLVGNPNSSGTDSNGTNSDAAAKRMQPGGDLFQRAMAKIGNVGGAPAPAPSSGGARGAIAPQPVPATGGFDPAALTQALLTPTTYATRPAVNAEDLVSVEAFLPPERGGPSLQTTNRYAGDLLTTLIGQVAGGAPVTPRAPMDIPSPAVNIAQAEARPQATSAPSGAPSGAVPFQRSVSTSYDTGQPGLDLYFEDKNFRALLPGRVKDIGYQGSGRGASGRGYGNYVVVESIDPATRKPVDVLYGHLDQVGVKRGDEIGEGFSVGRQGGTGRVLSQDGTIASVDFLAPAPAGSGSMTPYQHFDPLRRQLAKRWSV